MSSRGLHNVSGAGGASTVAAHTPIAQYQHHHHHHCHNCHNNQYITFSIVIIIIASLIIITMLFTVTGHVTESHCWQFAFVILTTVQFNSILF